MVVYQYASTSLDYSKIDWHKAIKGNESSTKTVFPASSPIREHGIFLGGVSNKKHITEQKTAPL